MGVKSLFDKLTRDLAPGIANIDQIVKECALYSLDKHLVEDDEMDIDKVHDNSNDEKVKLEKSMKDKFGVDL